MSGGRPTIYTDELAEKICLAIATHGNGLKTICKDNPEFPCARTIFRWRFQNAKFCHLYNKAKLYQAEILADEIVDIADEISHDVVYTKDGTPQCNTEYVNRSRLRIDARKWKASKLEPQRYGDRQEISSNPDGHALILKVLDQKDKS